MPRVGGVDVAPPLAAQAAPVIRDGWQEVADKVKSFALSVWGAVILLTGLATLFFGIKIGLIVGAVSSLIAFAYQSLSNRGNQPPVQERPAEPERRQGPGDAAVPRGAPALEPVRFDDDRWEFDYFNANDAGRRAMNAEIFQQTLQVIQRGGINRFDERIDIDRGLHEEMINGVRLYNNPRPAAAPRVLRVEAPIEEWVEVRAQTTFEAVVEMRAAGYNPLVLDMANAYVKGGGVLHGALAQEEALCRQSNLYLGLEEAERQGGYPIPVHGGILVPKVQFFRRDADLAYRFVRPIAADVFVSASFNSNRRHEGGFDRPLNEDVYREGMKAKMRTMFRAAIENGNDSLLLSAFGCGAFRNPPNLIARLYREVLNEPEFNRAFVKVRFGIYDPPRAERPNMPIFRDVLLGN